MSTIKDMVGQRFGRLEVVARADNNKWNQACWVCRCDCGNVHVANGGLLRRKHVTSCGCFHKEMISDLGKESKTHGLTDHPLYGTWSNMMNRCYNPQNRSWSCYGGRGIKVDSRWHDIRNFVTDMGDKPTGMSLERVDVNGHYTPSNCIWATAKVQANNKRSTVHVEHEGKTTTLSYLSQSTGIPYGTLYNQCVVKGADVEDVVCSWKPTARHPRSVVYKGTEVNLRELALSVGIAYGTLWHRINKKNMTADDAVNYNKENKHAIDSSVH